MTKTQKPVALLPLFCVVILTLTGCFSQSDPGLDIGDRAAAIIDEPYRQSRALRAVLTFEDALTEAEREFIRENPVIYFAAEHDNYPISFFNSRYMEWQGIAFDILREVELLTGMEFVPINEPDVKWPELLSMLTRGEVKMITELVHTPARAEYFLWPNNPIMTDRLMLISRYELPNLTLREVNSARVALARDTVYTISFMQAFPDHQNYLEFDSIAYAFDSLTRGEVDLVMHRGTGLLRLALYQELTGYKVNVLFDQRFYAAFGFHKDAGALISVIDKALELIEIDIIVQQWLTRTYDYRFQVIAAQRPWIIGVAGLFLFALILLARLFYTKSREGIRLEKLVQKRTAALEAAQKEAQAANKAKSDFLSTISHEIRTPMNVILGITEIQLDKDEHEPQIKEAFGKIYTSGDILLGIINDLLDLSKIEAGKMELINDDYDVVSLISETAQLNMMRIGSKRIEFKLSADENMPAMLWGDELRVKQVLNNVLSNAFKYTEAGVVSMSAHAEPVDDKEVMLVFTISDTGQGMTKEQTEKLFDEYYRFNLEANRKTEGTGLGMSITRNLVRMMNGEISVESEPGKGTKFQIRLPQGNSETSRGVIGKESAENLSNFRISGMAQMKRAQITREPMPYGNVLIVDDVETNIYVATGLMAPYKLKIDTAASGFEAIDKLKTGAEYDIVFMDHMMPKMDGIETVIKLREMGYKHPIVALTANAVAGRTDIFAKSGFDHFISKPIDIRELNSVLNKFVRDKQPPHVLEAANRGAGEETADSGNPPAGKSCGIKNKKIAGLNIIKGLNKYGNDEKVYLRILRSFAANTRSLFETLEDVSRENLRDYEISVHSIKGTSFSIFADETGKKAKELEEAAIEGNLDFIKKHNPGFLEELRAFVEQIETMLASIDDENPKPQKDKPDLDVLAELLAACKIFSMTGVNAAMEKIESYQYTSDDGLTQWLREKIKIMKFAEIAEKLNELDLEAEAEGETNGES